MHMYVSRYSSVQQTSTLKISLFKAIFEVCGQRCDSVYSRYLSEELMCYNVYCVVCHINKIIRQSKRNYFITVHIKLRSTNYKTQDLKWDSNHTHSPTNKQKS